MNFFQVDISILYLILSASHQLSQIITDERYTLHVLNCIRVCDDKNNYTCAWH